mmetsp:Transcript_26651/g.63165  ORF Transcript_26651/g.63165 Transcript_26651/m.63165 type:complete len:92 (+) Transcript_26651:123-398(+)
MVFRNLLQDSIGSDEAADFWTGFLPKAQDTLKPDGVAGFVIIFVLFSFVIGCMITKMAGMAKQIENLEHRMQAAETFQEGMKKDEDAGLLP